MSEGDAHRPRFGKVFRKDGSEQPLVFYATDDPNVFKAVDPKSENGLVMGQGDRFQVDYLGPGQTVLFAQGNDQFARPSSGHLAGPPMKEEGMSDNPNTDPRPGEFVPDPNNPNRGYIDYPVVNGPVAGDKPKDPNGWWKGLVMIAGLAAIVVLTIAGINWAIGL